jgi:hypothetical protein
MRADILLAMNQRETELQHELHNLTAHQHYKYGASSSTSGA